MRSTPLSPRRQALATLPMTAAVSAALSATALLLPSTASAQLEEVVVTARARAECFLPARRRPWPAAPPPPPVPHQFISLGLSLHSGKGAV